MRLAPTDGFGEPEGRGAGHVRRCTACGTPLVGKRRNAVYCDGACRAEASRRRRAARLSGAEPSSWFWSGWWGWPVVPSAQKRTGEGTGRHKSSPVQGNSAEALGTQYPAWLDSPTLTEAERAGLLAVHQLVLAGEAEWIDEDDPQVATEVVWNFTGGRR